MGDGKEDPIQRLPAGIHGIPPDVVTRNQRERLIAAVAEACAEHGYAEISVADLARRAHVSTATFYKLFPGKLECALAAHNELSERLLAELDRVCAGEPDRRRRARVATATVLELFAADPPTARLLTVEVLALGPDGAERNDAVIEALVRRLRAARDDDPRVAAGAGWVLVAGISALIGKRVMVGAGADLPQLEDELVALLLSHPE